MTKYKAIFFDFDGVILDTLEAKGRAFARLYTKNLNDKTFQQVMNFHLTHGGMNRVEKIKRIHETLSGIEISETELNAKLEELKIYMRASLFECTPIDQYVIPLIKSLAEKTPLWVVSAAPKDELVDLCKNLKIENQFREILGSCKKTDVLKKLLDSLALNSNDVLFIGDAEEDYKAAVNNNIPFVLKRNQNNITEFSKAFTGDAISNFSELEKYL